MGEMMETIVSLENIRLNLGSNLIFHDLSYLFQNQIYVLKGESGIGKTTLLNLIGGYIKSQEGKVTITNGRKTSYLFQENLLFHNLTVRENLFIKFYANDKDENKFEELIGDIIEKLQIKNLIDKKVNLLSGGEKQRVQLALLSLDNAEILLMDEPISNVDAENAEKILSYVESIVKDKLIIIVSHQPVCLDTKYQLLELREGKIYEVER